MTTTPKPNFETPSPVAENLSQKSLAAVFRRVLEILGAKLFVGLVLAIGALFFFGWLADEVLEGATLQFDNAVRGFVHGFASPLTTEAMRFLTFLGSTVFLVSLGLGVVAIFLFILRRRAAILFALTMCGAIVLNFSLKAGFQRTRPEPYFETPLPSSFSFPSGHALFSLCFYGVLAWLIATRINNRTAKILLWTAASLLIFLIGLSRIYLGVHYPSDVVAGFAAAFVWLITVALCDKILRKRTVIKETNG